MIYGEVSLVPSDRASKKLACIKRTMEWKGSIQHEINYGCFSGGLLIDSHLSYRIKDLYFLDEEKGTLVLMSGVIYNRKEIIDQYAFNPQINDPELVLMSFYKSGHEFVNKLNGDFSIFIYQKKANQSFLYRDHLGVRPLATSMTNELLYFSSDVMGLSKALYSNEEINRQFKFRVVSASDLNSYSATPNKKVSKLLPAHFLSFSNKGYTIKKYWHPEEITTDKKMSFLTLKMELKGIVEDAVKIRSDSRFIASSHLSGGLDSGIIAALVKKEFAHQENFYGFSWSPDGHAPDNLEFDERDYAINICNYCGIKPVFNSIKLADFEDCVYENRTPSLYMDECNIIKMARQKKVNLIFSGWGGDEFISINSRGIDSDLFLKMQWLSFLKKYPIKNPKRLLRALIYNVIYPAFGKIHNSGIKSTDDYSIYLKMLPTDKIKGGVNLYSWKSRQEVHLDLLYNYHITERLEEWAINGCRNGIEYRYPLLDKRIIEYMLKVPSRLLFKDNYVRIVLREISEGLLPNEIRWLLQKKEPFIIYNRKKLVDRFCKTQLNQLNNLKANIELDFINFDLLEKDLDEYLREPIDKDVHESAWTFLFIIKLHEFIKEYHKI